MPAAPAGRSILELLCCCCGPGTSRPIRSSVLDWRTHPTIQQYELQSIIGEGGFSEVWLARHHVTGDHAAIKVVYLSRPGLRKEEAAVLESEAKFLCLLDHPHILHCRAVLETKYDLVLVLEHLTGGELLDHLHLVHQLDEGQAARLFCQIVQAVAYMHNLNILHRDIKPENVMFCRPVPWYQSRSLQPQVKLIDLGMAAVHRPGGPNPQGCLGSPGFIAPEVIRGAEHSPAMDVYALGSLLFVMLTGRKEGAGVGTWVWELRDVHSLTYARLRLRDAPGLEDARFLACSPAAQALIQWMMADRPEDRPTAAQVLSHAWSKGEGGGSHRVVMDPEVRRRMMKLASLRRYKGLAFALMMNADHGATVGSISRNSPTTLSRQNSASSGFNTPTTNHQLPTTTNSNHHGNTASGMSPPIASHRRPGSLVEGPSTSLPHHHHQHHRSVMSDLIPTHSHGHRRGSSMCESSGPSFSGAPWYAPQQHLMRGDTQGEGGWQSPGGRSPASSFIHLHPQENLGDDGPQNSAASSFTHQHSHNRVEDGAHTPGHTPGHTPAGGFSRLRPDSAVQRSGWSVNDARTRWGSGGAGRGCSAGGPAPGPLDHPSLPAMPTIPPGLPPASVQPAEDQHCYHHSRSADLIASSIARPVRDNADPVKSTALLRVSAPFPSPAQAPASPRSPPHPPASPCSAPPPDPAWSALELEGDSHSSSMFRHVPDALPGGPSRGNSMFQRVPDDLRGDSRSSSVFRRAPDALFTAIRLQRKVMHQEIKSRARARHPREPRVDMQGNADGRTAPPTDSLPQQQQQRVPGPSDSGQGSMLVRLGRRMSQALSGLLPAALLEGGGEEEGTPLLVKAGSGNIGRTGSGNAGGTGSGNAGGVGSGKVGRASSGNVAGVVRSASGNTGAAVAGMAVADGATDVGGMVGAGLGAAVVEEGLRRSGSKARAHHKRSKAASQPGPGTVEEEEEREIPAVRVGAADGAEGMSVWADSRSHQTRPLLSAFGRGSSTHPRHTPFGLDSPFGLANSAFLTSTPAPGATHELTSISVPGPGTTTTSSAVPKSGTPAHNTRGPTSHTTTPAHTATTTNANTTATLSPAAAVPSATGGQLRTHSSRVDEEALWEVGVVATALQAAPQLTRSWTAPEHGSLPNVLENAIGAAAPRCNHWDIQEQMRAISLNPLTLAFLDSEAQLREVLGGRAADMALGQGGAEGRRADGKADGGEGGRRSDGVLSLGSSSADLSQHPYLARLMSSTSSLTLDHTLTLDHHNALGHHTLDYPHHTLDHHNALGHPLDHHHNALDHPLELQRLLSSASSSLASLQHHITHVPPSILLHPALTAPHCTLTAPHAVANRSPGAPLQTRGSGSTVGSGSGGYGGSGNGGSGDGGNSGGGAGAHHLASSGQVSSGRVSLERISSGQFSLGQISTGQQASLTAEPPPP